MKNFTEEFLDDIFKVRPKAEKDVPDDADEESHDSAYAEVAITKNNETFEQKTEQLKEKIGSSPLREEVEFADKPTISSLVSGVPTSTTKVLPIQGEKKEDGKEKKIDKKDDFEIFLKSEISSATVPVKQAQEVGVQPPSNDTSHGTEDKREVHDIVRDESGHVPIPVPAKRQITSDDDLRNDHWLIDAPSPMFDHFYGEKRTVLRKILANGKIPINDYYDEIFTAKINIGAVTIDDRSLIAEKMKDVQKWRERLTEMKGRVNRVLGYSERFLELLRAMLMKVQYEKPAQKQDAANYEHIRDIEEYISNLGSLNEYMKEVSINMHTTFETLSRIMTLATANRIGLEVHEMAPAGPKPQTIAESYKQSEHTQKVKAQSLVGFDKIEESGVENSNISDKKPKSREVEWV